MKHLFVLTFFVFESFARVLFNGTWSVAFTQPIGRHRFGMTCTNDTMYVLGGETADGLTNNFMKYSLTTQRWTTFHVTGPFPPTQFHTLSFIDPYVIAFGGTTDIDPNNDMYMVDLYSTNGTQKNIWVKVNPMGLVPSPRMRHRSVTAGSDLYYFFGRGLDRLVNTVWKFDTNTLLWERVHDGKGIAPTGRFDACCKFWPEKRASLCFGGMDANDDLNDMWVFFHDNRTWREIVYSKAPGNIFPQKRRGHSCGIRKSVLVIYGGFYSTSGIYAGTSIYQMDLSNYPLGPFVWVSSPNVNGPQPRDSAVMCDGFNQTSMLFGGNDQTSLKHNDLWALDSNQNGTLSFQKVHGDAAIPRHRSGAIARAYGTSIVFGTGKLSQNLFTDDIWIFSAVTMTWKELSPHQSSGFMGRYGAAGVIRGQLLVIFGGQVNPSDATSLSNQL
eukprot:PhF_6_TR9997/c0_g1_i1/m.15206